MQSKKSSLVEALANTVKYISRAGKKGGSSTLQDLEKDRWYLDREIQQARLRADTDPPRKSRKRRKKQ